MLDYSQNFYNELKQYFKRIIHPRRLIIASDKKVMQFPISVGLQLSVIGVLATGVLWSCYSTGRFIAVNSTVEAQMNAIRSVTAAKTSDINILSSISPVTALPKESITHLTLIHENKLKMAELEKKVAELKNANDAIIERVREKTDGQLNNLESIVTQTGLKPDSILEHIENTETTSTNGGKGGPFIPSELPAISEEASTMLNSLDRLKALRQVVAGLPFGIPIENADERSQFGHRIDPFNGRIAFHSGLDLSGPANAPILSSADGIVVEARRDGAYGNKIDIDHGFGIVTRYGHLSTIKVHEGQKVKKGQIIGTEGSTGRSTGSHLHYEVRYNGEAINPEKFLRTGRLLELGSAVSQE